MYWWIKQKNNCKSISTEKRQKDFANLYPKTKLRKVGEFLSFVVL